MPVAKGGLNLPDLVAMDKASKIAWIGRMTRLQNLIFVRVLQKRLQATVQDIVRTDFDSKWILGRVEYRCKIIFWGFQYRHAVFLM